MFSEPTTPASCKALISLAEYRNSPRMSSLCSLKDRAESEPNRPAAYPDGLTQREVEVLALIAAGKSNREITKELIISLHTVNYYVKNIFTETDVSNRAEALAYVPRPLDPAAGSLLEPNPCTNERW